MGHSGNRWRAVWAISALLLLYLHHIAVLVVAMEVILALALSVRHLGPHAGLSRWLPWMLAVAALAIPDLLLLRHQEALTGYLPAAAASVILPVRQFLRVTISFPGELLVPMFLAFVLLPWSVVWWRRRRHAGADVDVVGGLHGAMVLVSFLLIAAAYRQSILVDHVLLSLAPLGMALVAAALGHLLAHGRRVLAVVLLQAAVAGATLSALATVGAVKTNIDIVAHAIAADARGDDLVVLAAGAPGASFNWYLERQLSQIDFPVIGPVARYRFDRGFERLADTTALRLATDSIVATAAGLRRLWFVYPANWDVTSPAPRVLPNSMPGIEARRSRAALLHHIVMGCFGAPVAQFSGLDTPWGMEIMSFQLFAAQPDQREHLGTDCQRG
jgi:hypothetical protein